MFRAGLAMKMNKSFHVVRFVLSFSPGRYSYHTTILISQLILIALLCSRTAKNPIHRHHTIYPYSSVSKHHFINALRPFTIFHSGNRYLGSKSNISDTPGLQDIERRLLDVFIKEYMLFHAANRRNATRILLFRPHPTGMGDQFSSLIFSYWTAVLSRRLLLVDWQLPFSIERFLETASKTTDMFIRPGSDFVHSNRVSRAFLNSSEESHARFIQIMESDTHAVFHSPWIAAPRTVLRLFAERNRAHDLSVTDVHRLLLNVNFHRAIAHFVFRLGPGIRNAQNHECNIMGLACASATIQTEFVSDFKNLQLHRRPYIAVHGRIGTGVGELGSRFWKVAQDILIPARCLASRAVRLAMLAGNPALPIFLATDTPRFREVFHRVVYNMTHGRIEVVNGNWSVAHSNKIAHRISLRHAGGVKAVGDEAIKEQNNVWSSYLDLVMLGHAEHIVALYSSFPRFALAVGNAETLTELRNDICTNVESWLD